MKEPRLIYELDNMWNQYTQNTRPEWQDETERAYHHIRFILQQYYEKREGIT